MKVLIGAAAAVLLCAATASAQTGTPPAPPSPPAAVAPLASSCGALQTAPTLPAGSNATQAQMNHGNDAYTAWATDTRAKLECRQGEIRTAVAQATAAETAYNASAQQLNSVGTSWQAEVATFNARGQIVHEQRGGVVSSSDHDTHGHH
jgi:hypothetical protein